ncbi:MAG: nucleotidyl transferase AbiEii/AbiGii toxin family protein [Candidatus Rhabdochlamydia sp.]
MTSDVEKSFKAKLRLIAKELNKDPADLWQTLTLERFLVRLSHSPYKDQFILKGGVLLSKYLTIGRETTDLDFLAQKVRNEKSNLMMIFETVAAISLEDGFMFKEVNFEELAHPHMGYSGARISMMAYFGKTRMKVVIDLGFGDIVDPVNYAIPLTTSSRGDLFERCVFLPCYPQEFIFAEKLETVVHRGALNSRMKDFHDLYSMISSPSLQPVNHLKAIIEMVFHHRGTQLILPLLYEENDLAKLQIFWNQYLKGVRSDSLKDLPKQLSTILSEMNQWLLPHFSSKVK